MTGEDLLKAGYVRALWMPGAERHWMRPDSSSVCTESEALREIAELVSAANEGDHEAPRSAA